MSCNERHASFRKKRNLLHVPTDPGDEGPNLTVLESVRCLECGAIYAKPAAGGTVRENPGCPDCSYVGWVAAGLMALGDSSMPHHSVAGPLRHRND
jgi:hypothetical protein